MPDDRNRGRRAALEILNRLEASKEASPPVAPAPAAPAMTMPIQITGMDNLAAIVEGLADQAATNAEFTAALMESVADEPTPADFSGIVKAIKDAKPEKSDYSAVVEAIGRVTAATQKQADTSNKVAEAISQNTAAIRDLVAVAKSPKRVTYDADGRITEIRVG